MKLLIADDSPVMCQMLRAILEPMGYEVLEAGSGLRALEILTGPDAPSLAILDWVMPGKDGPDVCREVRQSTLDLQPYLILLTRKDTKEDMIQGLEMGANDFIYKPFHSGELMARIKVGERVMLLEMAQLERVHALEEALAHVKTLQGMLPICMYCHKIRNDQETWQRLESYLTEHSEATLSHGLCPDCTNRFRDGMKLPGTQPGGKSDR